MTFSEKKISSSVEIRKSVVLDPIYLYWLAANTEVDYVISNFDFVFGESLQLRIVTNYIKILCQILIRLLFNVFFYQKKSYFFKFIICK
jgi:hypothetical protein